MILGTLHGNTTTCTNLKFYANLHNSKQMTDIQPISAYQFTCKMEHKFALGQTEKSKTAQKLHKNIYTLQIAKELNRDHGTIKKFVTNPERCNGRSDKAHVSHRVMSRSKREIRRNPFEISKKSL